MWIVTTIVIVILLLITVTLLSKIRADVWVRKDGKDDEAVLKIRMLFGLIRLHYELPMLKIENLEKGIMIEVDKSKNIGQEKEAHNETQIDKRKVDLWLNVIHQILEATESLKVWMERTLSRLSISKFEWSTHFCAGDAAYTAVASGMVWSAKAFIVGWLSHHVQLKKSPRLFVVPTYDDHPHFTSEMSCIVQISCGYAIYAGLVLILRVLKVKGGVKRWKTILSKA